MKTKLFLFLFVCITSHACQSNENTSVEKSISTNTLVEDSIPPSTTHVEYYENGEIKLEAEILDGLFNGSFREYNSNGSLSKTGNMVKGRKNGIWRTFDQSGSLESAELYNLDELLFELDPNDFLFESVLFDGQNMEILLPAKWENKLTSNNNILIQSVKKCDASIGFCPNLTVAVERIGLNISPEDYINKSVETMTNQFPDLRVIAQGDVIINGLSSFQITYIFQTEGIKLGGITTWIFSSDKAYVVTGMASNQEKSEFLRYKDYFQEISSSIKKM